MFAFTLSKMNLLILVIAVFAIVSYFTLQLGEIIKVKEAELIAKRVADDAAILLDGPMPCGSHQSYLKPSLSVLGQQDLHYVLRISKKPLEGTNLQLLTFSISSAREQKYVVAASSIASSAEINLYYYDQELGRTGGLGTTPFIKAPEKEGAVFDPQAVIPINAVYLIKETELGKTKFYIFPCSVKSTLSTCELWKTEVAKIATSKGVFCVD